MGLRFKLFIPSLILLATVLLLIHYYWLPQYLDSEVEHQFEYERSYIKLLSDTIAPDLLTNNYDRIHSTLDRALSSNEYWHAIRLHKKGQERIYPPSGDKLPDTTSLEPIQRTIRYNNENVANITVWIDIKSSSKERLSHLNYLEQLIISLLLGVSLITILLQDRWIRTPLKQLASLAKEITLGHYDANIDYHSQDEVGTLASSLNSMREQINNREKKLKHYSAIQSDIRQIQENFIQNKNNETVFIDLLQHVLKYTESEHGFIGEILTDKDNKPYIRTFCASNAFFNDKDPDNKHGEGIEIHNLESLPGKVLTKEQHIIQNRLTKDDIRSDKLKNFLGMPIIIGNRIIGVVGVANNKNGYSDDSYENAKTLLDALGGLIIAHREEKALHESETRFRTVVDKAADGMITINSRGIMQACNTAVERLFGYSSSEMIGNNVTMLMPEPYKSQHDHYIANYLTTGVKNIIGINREVKGLHKNGSTFPLDLAVSEIELNGERMFIGIARDITRRAQAEEIRKRYAKSLEQLHRITTQTDLSFNQKVESLLKLGQEIFNLPLAIVSHIEKHNYTVEYCVGPEDSPQPGNEFPLDKTYCGETLASNKATGYNNISKSGPSKHPCFVNFKAEAYIGAPLYKKDTPYGTLSFLGPNVHDDAFTVLDYSLIQLFAQWIGTEMARVEAESELELAYIEVNQANAELEKLSRTDALTGAANRRYFDEVLAQELNRAIRKHSQLTLIICDIDYFKAYNDTYGHQAGDACLQQITKAIQATFSRAGELVARYGGEEFAIILPEISMEDGLKLAEEMRMNVTNLHLEHKSSSIADRVTLSAGVASLIPDQNTTMAVLIEQADKALYNAKENGRNNIRPYSDS